MLSVVVITKNESRNLPRCLASVASVADEVVVVDSGSTDDTVALAKAHGARVFERPFDSYAQQKNWAADQARGTHVLSLDADEALSEGLIGEILEWKRVAGDERVAWSMPRLTEYCGTWIRHGGWYPDRKIRLWSANDGAWKCAHEEAMLHEAWVPNDEVEVRSFASDLLHYSYGSTDEHHRQWTSFTVAGALDARAAGRTSMWLKPLARGVFQFFKGYVLLSGWRDGRAGFEVARWSALAAMWKWRMVGSHDKRQNLRRIAVVRTDAMGDNVLTLPLAGALKGMFPDIELIWICRPYTSTIVERSSHVDTTMVWRPEEMSEAQEAKMFQGMDAVVFAFPEPRLLRAAAMARVPIRIATGRRWSSLRWANQKIWRGRKRRAEHETLQGLRLVQCLGVPARWRFPSRQDWFGLTGLEKAGTASEARQIAGISKESWNQAVVLHPGNRGSANGWSIQRFQALSAALLQSGRCVIVTGSKEERTPLISWLESEQQGNDHFVDAVGKVDLDQLMCILSHVSCVVASSTGPLHLASAMGTPVVGLYCSNWPFWPERWGPLGEGTVLSTHRVAEEGGLDLSVDEVFAAVKAAP